MYSSFKNSTDATGMMKCDQGKATMSLAILHINEPYRTYYYLSDVQKDRLREYIMNNMVSEELQTLRDQCAIIKTIAP